MEANLNNLNLWKLLILPLLLSTPSALAEEDENYVEPVYEEPGAPEPWEAGGSRKFLDYTSEEKSKLNIPERGSREDYIRWAQSLMLAKKKEALARAARAQPTGVRGVKCIPHYRSFGFKSKDGQPLSTSNEVSVYCDAGKNELQPSHGVYNNIRVQDNPVACTGDARIQEYFSRDNTWNRRGAEEFVTLLKVTGCSFLASSQNHITRPPPPQRISEGRAKLYDPSRGGSIHTRERKTKNPMGDFVRPRPGARPRTLDGEGESVTIPAK